MHKNLMHRKITNSFAQKVNYLTIAFLNVKYYYQNSFYFVLFNLKMILFILLLYNNDYDNKEGLEYRRKLKKAFLSI